MLAILCVCNYFYVYSSDYLLAVYDGLCDPFREKRAELEKDPDALEDILKAGAARARAEAAKVMDKVREAVGL